MERFQNFHVFSEVNKMIIKAEIAYLILTKQKSIIPPHSKNIWLSDSQSQQKSCDCTGGRVFCQHKSWVPETGAPTLPAPSSVNTPGNQHFPEPGNGDDGAERGAHLLTDALGSVEVYFCKAVTLIKPMPCSHTRSPAQVHTHCAPEGQSLRITRSSSFSISCWSAARGESRSATNRHLRRHSTFCISLGKAANTGLGTSYLLWVAEGVK